MNRDTDRATSTPLHSVSVAGAVIRKDGRMLAIQRRDNGTWEPPGGILELEETPEEGVIREVLEETGVHVEVERLTGVYKNMARGVIALVFLCKPSGGRERPTSEATAVEWINPNEISKRMTDAYAIRLLDAIKDDTPHVRTHNGIILTKRSK